MVKQLPYNFLSSAVYVDQLLRRTALKNVCTQFYAYLILLWFASVYSSLHTQLVGFACKHFKFVRLVTKNANQSSIFCSMNVLGNTCCNLFSAFFA